MLRLCCGLSPSAPKLFSLPTCGFRKVKSFRIRAFGTAAPVASEKNGGDTFFAEDDVSWKSLGVSDRLSRSLSSIGFQRPSLVQAACIPNILSGADVVVAAETGSGKTHGYLVPLIDKLSESGGADDSDDEDEDDVFVPLRDHMKIWLEKKPRGFGEGEVYDTSIEDKLMEEIEQSRRAQLVNLNKLKNNPPLNPASKKKQIHQEEKHTRVSTGSNHVRVRLINLPKKRNVDRDLQSAFKEFPGIVNINPIVSGKAKTRDPTCKGIAFIDFKSEDVAHRFVQTFSGTSICFGKIQKHIKCVMMNSNPANPKNTQLPDETSHCYDLAEADCDGEVSGTFVGTTNSGDDEQKSATAEEGVGGGNSSSFSAVQKKTGVNEKKKKVERQKKGKSSGISNILGSAKRLKIREKAQLTGVLSKYGLK